MEGLSPLPKALLVLHTGAIEPITHRRMLSQAYLRPIPFATTTLQRPSAPAKALNTLLPTLGSELSSQHSWKFATHPSPCPLHEIFSDPMSMCQELDYLI